MTLTIYKFPVVVDDLFEIMATEEMHPLAVQMQNGKPYLWAEIDPFHPMRKRTFAIIGTGNPIHWPERTYIGTFQQPPFVWHLYEVTP